jgi:hypothetical protein
MEINMTNYFREISTEQEYAINVHRKLEDIQTINTSGTYNITESETVQVSAIGNVILNYNDNVTEEGNSQITINNINGAQSIIVNGFSSEDLQQLAQARLGDPITIALIMDVAAFAIYEYGMLIFLTGASPEPMTTIELDPNQTITLHNVSRSDLTSDNFIFATEPDNDSGEEGFDYATLYLSLEIIGGIIGGTAILAGAYKCYQSVSDSEFDGV